MFLKDPAIGFILQDTATPHAHEDAILGSFYGVNPRLVHGGVTVIVDGPGSRLKIESAETGRRGCPHCVAAHVYGVDHIIWKSAAGLRVGGNLAAAESVQAPHG